MNCKTTFVAGLMAVAMTTASRADLVISSAATQNVDCNGGTCSATAPRATLNVADLNAMLAQGSVTISTLNIAKAIDVEASFSWTNQNRLTLDAYQSVTIKRPVVVAGTGAMTILTNRGDIGGDLRFQGSGRLEFWDLTSGLVINAKSYHLVDSISSLASKIAAHPSGFYALARNYNAKKDGIYRRSPISTTFTGTFEGLGNTISGLAIDVSDDLYAGLFEEVDTGGVLRDVRLKKANLQFPNSGLSAGTLLGVGKGARIIGAEADGIVSAPGASSSGILVGNMEFGEIDYSTSSGSVTGTTDVGGLAGMTYDSWIRWSSSSAAVSGAGAKARVGGLVGYIYSTQGPAYGVDHSFATGTVRATGPEYAGGLVGSTYTALISNSYATGSVTGVDGLRVGGLVGWGQGSIMNAYATGSVTAGKNSSVGGLAGYKDQPVDAAYSTGAVSAGSGSYLGGSIGEDGAGSNENEAIYWDLDTSGVSDPSKGAGNVANDGGVSGLTSQQLRSGLPAGFLSTVWAQNPTINNGFPYLVGMAP